ncbi:hypothetical protein GA830_10465 [Mesorhizobium sp. NBSH29]|uniref:hypothetical protein n=1 Tax=Mesorhizobium sp. NBSH29 TaxID=2654249 RepID=UPI0018968379|nr:hypothetical protein [Mesorhizobium sp. NBSH29]QPC87117.1 hypothetical protein GA830_10465 [Mesorhizobium sp. NBSH29]
MMLVPMQVGDFLLFYEIQQWEYLPGTTLGEVMGGAVLMLVDNPDSDAYRNYRATSDALVVLGPVEAVGPKTFKVPGRKRLSRAGAVASVSSRSQVEALKDRVIRVEEAARMRVKAIGGELQNERDELEARLAPRGEKAIHEYLGTIFSVLPQFPYRKRG